MLAFRLEKTTELLLLGGVPPDIPRGDETRSEREADILCFVEGGASAS